MGLKACVRQGTTIVVHPDQVRQWTNAGSEFGEKFATLKADHDARYMRMLKDAISSQGGASGANPPQPVADDGDVDGGATPDAPGPTDSGEDAPGPVTFSSEQKLAEVDPILSCCQSEVSGIELIRTKSGKLYLISQKERVLAKWTLLGGYGTGKYLVINGGIIVLFVLVCTKVCRKKGGHSG